MAAKDPYQGYDFAGWLKLSWGGDDTGDFIENDLGSGGTIGDPGFYEHVPGTTYNALQGTYTELLASYGYYNAPNPPDPRFKFYEFLERSILKYRYKGDPGPWDPIRLRALEHLLHETEPGITEVSEFQRMIEMAPSMSAKQLQQAIRSVKTTMQLGKTALSDLEERLKSKPE